MMGLRIEQFIMHFFKGTAKYLEGGRLKNILDGIIMTTVSH